MENITMKKTVVITISIMAMVILVVLYSGAASAGLTTIGTADYNGEQYNLIWENNNNGKSLVWLDYVKGEDTWTNQMNWAAGLSNNLTINLNPNYTVNWGGSWRLPDAGADPQGGYNQTSSEMGYLYYVSLQNNGGGYNNNTGEFSNLILSEFIQYYSGTEKFGNDPKNVWRTQINWTGAYQAHGGKALEYYAFAVTDAQVQAVPVPGSVLLLMSGLIGLGVVKKRTGKQKQA